MIQSGGSQGMQTMDSHIQRLFDSGRISGEEAYMKAFDKHIFEKHWKFEVGEDNPEEEEKK
jgi:Tfp pilus assembly pilus retraction ATPase PilT